MKKNSSRFFGFAAPAALAALCAALILTACPTGGGGGDGTGTVNTPATSMSYTGTGSNGKTVIVKIAKTAAAARAVTAYKPARGDHYSVQYKGGPIVDEGTLSTVSGTAITCKSTVNSSKSFTINGKTISPITITEGDTPNIGKPITITDVIVDDGTGSGTPSLTVTNFTGTFYGVEIHHDSPAITTKSEYDASLSMVAFCGPDDDNSSPYEAFKISPGETFNPNGKYMIDIGTDGVHKFQVGVQFTNGRAAVDFSAMTDYYSLPDSTPSLTVNNLTGTFVGIEIRPYRPEPATWSDWQAIMAIDTLAVCVAADDNSSPFDLQILPGNTFDPNGQYVVLVTTESGERFKVDVQFTNGSAAVDFSAMTDPTTLP
jgi:hypothetical protein